DSFAAHLYPGLKGEELANNYRVAQFTFNACPPLLDIDVPGRPYCRNYQGDMLEKVIALKPTYLVMASAWGMVQPMPIFLKQLDLTIGKIPARLPTVRITVVGNPPIWKERLPALMETLSVVQNGELVSAPGIRLSNQTDGIYDHDAELGSVAAADHVNYFSL